MDTNRRFAAEQATPSVGRLRGHRTRLQWTFEDHPQAAKLEPPLQSLPPSAFTLAERRQEGATTQWIYQRVGAPKSCLYKVVILEKAVDPSDTTSWSAYGFTSMKAYKANSNVWLNCPLVKLD
ncbi:hypothetical protein [Caulobacter sp. LjRoot300]|uniref:hypothetical protein n=1 Tax=Caulobacter sp. LjRoot300 TaxID=3342321 RepID=UPI003ED14F9B